ncbi:hypothetical protein I302_108719 [Kwoniella bestiolae CBS 10118]|uniref:Uncharacterized protein n=1 Tax=Kwoniella bestiolae CBS 10118 TaxID=1296100 RepID=A0A1B9FTX1_9TREE|nr:hypothetical protein I302_07856 [Kwoniella bestiolae CBS 10118]OCF22211.1 hypothetical protein I302_07856 [Kwoniella bestiolae CBS 10118]
MPYIPFLLRSRSSRSSKPQTSAPLASGTCLSHDVAKSIDNLLQSGQLSPPSAVFLTELRYGVARTEDEQALQSAIKELDGLSSGVGTSGSTVDGQTVYAPRCMGSGTAEGRKCARTVREYLSSRKYGTVFEDVSLDD